MDVGAALLCPSRFLLPGGLFRSPLTPTPDSYSLSSEGCSLYWAQPHASAVCRRTKNTTDSNRSKTRAHQSCPTPGAFPAGMSSQTPWGESRGLGTPPGLVSPYLEGKVTCHFLEKEWKSQDDTVTPPGSPDPPQPPFLETQPQGLSHVRTGLLTCLKQTVLTALYLQSLPISVLSTATY